MKYHFTNIENGQIAEGYVVIDINGHEAEVGNDDAPAILLAEKHGGEILISKRRVVIEQLDKNVLKGSS